MPNLCYEARNRNVPHTQSVGAAARRRVLENIQVAFRYMIQMERRRLVAKYFNLN